MENENLILGRGKIVRDGNDVAIIATGSSVYDAVESANKLAENGISVKVVNMNCIKPIDQELLWGCLGAKLIVTVEEHSVIGGLGGAVAEVLSKLKMHPPLKMIGIGDCFLRPGEYEYLKSQMHLDGESIADSIMRELTGE